MSSPNTLNQRIALAIVPPLAALVIRALGVTLRFEEIAAPGVPSGDRIPSPAIYGFWHRSLLAGAYRFRNRGIAILISRSFDGELIARTVERLGFRAIRGSSSRGGATALRQMAEAYESGRICAMTVDGPKGPAQVAKAGAVQLAELVGASEIGSFYLLPERAWVLKTWDRMLIPKPFSRVRVTWAKPCAPNLPELQAGLDEAVRMAELRMDSGYPSFEHGHKAS